MTAAAEQEVIPYDVLLAQMETRLHRRDSEMLMLEARLEMRNRRIAQLTADLAAARGESAGGPSQGTEQQLENAQVQLPPPADQ